MSVLDLSSYDLDTLDAPCMRAAGVTGVILGVYSPSDAPNRMRQAAQSCRDAGIDILGFYGLVYFGDPHGETRDTRWAIQLAQEFDVNRVWLDCEMDARAAGWSQAPVPAPSGRVSAIHTAVDAVRLAGLSPGIYTGSWWWRPNTNDSTSFASLPLWHSDYGANDGTREPVLEVNYGGWTKVAVHQYTSRLFVCGRERDANYVFEEDEMTNEERQMLQEVWDALVGRGNPAGVTRLADWNANGNSLLDGYTIEQEKLADHLTVHPSGASVARGTVLKVEVL